MDIVKRITKNSSYVLFGSIISSLITFAINIYIARYLGSEIFGRYSFVFAYLAFFLILSVFGVDSILVRELSRAEGKEGKLISAGLMLKLATSSVATIISISLIMLLPYSSSIRLAVVFASLGLVFYSISMTLISFFQAKLEMMYYFIALVISKLVFLSLTVYVVYTSGGFVKMVIAASVAFVAQAGIMYLFASRRFSIATPKKGLCKALIRESWPLGIMDFFNTTYNKIGIVMLSLIKGTQEVGLYSAAYMITEAPVVISLAFMTSIYPLLSMYHKSSNSMFKELYVKSFKYMAMLGIPIVVGGFLLRKDIISLVYGASYSMSAAAFGILIFGSVLLILKTVLANSITAIDKQRYNMSIAGMATLLNIILNLILIQKLGFIGVAIASLITELLIFIALTYFIFREKEILPTEGLLKMLGASAVMGIFIELTNFSLVLTFLISVLIYGATLILLRVFDSRDKEFIGRVFKI